MCRYKNKVFMKLLIMDSVCPYRNLAIEEYAFEKMQDDIFILWQNEPTVVVGKNQNIKTELDIEYASEHGIHIARRITGGGAVYHDLGNINYSFISSTGKEGIDFEYFTKPIIDTLKNIGVNAELTGRNDIEVDGKKISGNAQYTKNGRTLHHGTLLFNTDLSVLDKVLHVDDEKVSSRAIKSMRSRVANLKDITSIEDIENIMVVIVASIIKKYSPEIISIPNDPYIDELEERNRSEEWLFPKSAYLSDYTVRRKKKYSFGLVEAEISMSGDVISDIKIRGDFFGNREISEIYEHIIGQNINEFGFVDDISIDDYIFGMSNEEFIELLK